VLIHQLGIQLLFATNNTVDYVFFFLNCDHKPLTQYCKLKLQIIKANKY
jgi:hypothetical protein